MGNYYKILSSISTSGSGGTSSLPLTNLVSYYKGSGNALDSKSTNNGTTTDIAYVSGLVGQSASFNGTTSKIEIANAVNLQINSGSISCVLNSSLMGSGFYGIISKNGAYGIYVNNGVLITYDFGGGAIRNTEININDGVSHTIVMTFNSGVASGTKIYIDGILRLTTVITVSYQTHILQIGCNTTVQFAKGLIDEVGIWNVVLTADEALEVENKLRTGVSLI